MDTLLKIRDYSSKRVAPALQRLSVLLQEVQGWAMLYVPIAQLPKSLLIALRSPQYALCDLDSTEIKAAIELVERGIVCANWLASASRRELLHFREFIEWLKYGARSPYSPVTSPHADLAPFRQRCSGRRTPVPTPPRHRLQNTMCSR